LGQSGPVLLGATAVVIGRHVVVREGRGDPTVAKTIHSRVLYAKRESFEIVIHCVA
jgi:hypothetical protein